MSKHTLSLDIPETATPHSFRIVDTSVYGDGLLVECQRLDITLPGFTQPAYISDVLTPGFAINFSGIDLGVHSSISGDPLVKLPDGVYTIRYSVSPNDKVYVEYKHLRTTITMNKYYLYLCDLELKPCEADADLKKELDYLRMIRMYIDAAKAMVEYCGDVKKGIALFTYAQKLLNKYKNTTCKNC